MPGSTTAIQSLTIGSRGSQLALWQARHIASALEKLGVASRIEIIKTTGDHLQTASLAQAGGKGLFTKEIEEALLAGSIDLAVHSLKDLPTETPHGLTIVAIPERDDPRDAMVGRKMSELPAGARVGTSSGRRAAQLLLLRPDLQIEPIRGNVDTRLRKLREGQYDAIMLAAAGLRRLGLANEIAETFPAELICPAPGQGALAIQTRESDLAGEVCAALNHGPTREAVICERAALAALGGGCQLPIGVFAQMMADDLAVHAIVISPDGRRHLKIRTTGPRSGAEELGRAVAGDLLARGAGAILEETR
jgi:hydroxymethylbilane synthase